MRKLSRFGAATAGLAILAACSAFAHEELGPETEQTFGQGLPRDRSLLWDDSQYLAWPLSEEQQAYAPINGDRMKEDVIALSEINIRYRDAGNKWWGRFPGTEADVEGMKYMTDRFEELGLTVESVPFKVPHDWRAKDWAATYTTSAGDKIDLQTAFPVADTMGTDAEGLTAEAIWVGIGAEADFAGRDVEGKAVVIYSYFAPGGRSHSANDRSGLFDANNLAAELGAAMVINVMGVPGNAQFQPEDALYDIPHWTLSMDEGFALRDRLGRGEKVDVTFNLEVEELHDVETAWTVATLPGHTDEEIVIMTHTDGYFQAAMDNNAGMASALELARFYSAKPIDERPRTLKFVQFPDHHHGHKVGAGESSLKSEDIGYNAVQNWDNVAVKLSLEHPSQTLLYMYNDTLTPANTIGGFRWNALGSPEFEQMVFDTFRDFGVSVYALENNPKNGAFAPSFHIIDHVIYHTSLDIPELVPANGLANATRAFAAVLDQANEMTMGEIRGDGWPYETGRGSLNGTEQVN